MKRKAKLKSTKNAKILGKLLAALLLPGMFFCLSTAHAENITEGTNIAGIEYIIYQPHDAYCGDNAHLVDSIQGNISLWGYAAGHRFDAMNLKMNNSNWHFDMKRQNNINMVAPNYFSKDAGVASIIAFDCDLNIIGEKNDKGDLPEIYITTKNNEHYYEGDKGSSTAVNHSIVAYVRLEQDKTLNIKNVNLNLDQVLSGLYACGGYYKANNAFKTYKASIVIKNDSIKILADQSDYLQKHAISVVDGGIIDIDSKNVDLRVGGIAAEKDNPLTVYNAGLYELYGGTIKINAENNLNIEVMTTATNDNSQNYGVYAIGQGDDYHWGNSGNIELTGKSAAGYKGNLHVKVGGAKRNSIGLVSLVKDFDASLSAHFNNISIEADGEGVFGETGHTQTGKWGDSARSNINIETENDLIIDAPIGIHAHSAWMDNTIKAQAKNINISSSDKVIYNDVKSNMKWIFWGNTYERDDYSIASKINLGADNIQLASEKFGVYQTAEKPLAENINDEVLTDVQASENLIISAPVVAYGEGKSTINLNSASESGGTNLDGGAVSRREADINIGLNTRDSRWVGFAQDSRTSSYEFAGEEFKEGINVDATNGATWYVRPVDDEDYRVDANDKKSYLTSWHSVDNSNIDLRLDNGTYQAVDIGKLSGQYTTFWLNTDVNGERGEGVSTDQAIIHSGFGNHKIMVRSTGREPWAEEQKDYLIWHKEENGATSTKIIDPEMGTTNSISENDLAFTLANQDQKVDVGAYSYILATRDAQTSGGSGTEWFLKRTDNLSPSGDVVTSLGGIGAQAAIWHAQLDDLRKRLGEVRYGAQDGVWVRTKKQKDSISGTAYRGFEQKWYGWNLGFDNIARQDEDKMWLVGGNLKYAKASQTLKNSSVGSGNLESYGMYLYTTYADYEGGYADFVFSLDKYSQEMSTTMSDYTRTKGDYDSWGWGISAEVGKMFSSTQDDEDWGPWYNHWWIEPQAQLSYYWTHGKNWSLDNGMQVSQRDGDSLVGRLGVVIGKQFKAGKYKQEVDKRYSQFYIKGGVKHEFLGRQTLFVNDEKFDNRLRGTSVYYGAGFDWNFDDQTRAYFQVERESGGKYHKDYEISLGLKWQF